MTRERRELTTRLESYYYIPAGVSPTASPVYMWCRGVYMYLLRKCLSV